MVDFFIAFWPNFISTILGITLGIPIALYLNRQILEKQAFIDESKSLNMVNNSIEVLLDAFEYNIKVLDKIGELALLGKVMRNPDLRLTTWSTVGVMLSGNLNNPELLQLLSHHWLRLQDLNELNKEIFARDILKILPELEDEQLVISFWQELYENTLALTSHAKEVRDRLKDLRA